MTLIIQKLECNLNETTFFTSILFSERCSLEMGIKLSWQWDIPCFFP